MADFTQTIATAYAVDGAALDLGRGVHDGAVVPAATVKLPLRMANRHGLIAGATGTGRTKTLQGLAEQLSAAGVPVFVAGGCRCSTCPTCARCSATSTPTTARPSWPGSAGSRPRRSGC